MRYSIVILAAASCVVAQKAGFDVITIPTANQTIKYGETFKFVWDPTGYDDKTVTIKLLGGADPRSLSEVREIAANVTNSDGGYEWKVFEKPEKSDEQYATYGLNITLDSDPSIFQLSNPFHISDTASESTTTSSTSSSAPTSASATAKSSDTDKASGSLDEDVTDSDDKIDTDSDDGNSTTSDDGSSTTSDDGSSNTSDDGSSNTSELPHELKPMMTRIPIPITTTD